MKPGTNRHCPYLSLLKPNPHEKRGKAKTVKLSRRPQVTFLTNVSTKMTRKCRGVANSTLRADLWTKRTRSLKAKRSKEDKWPMLLGGLYSFRRI
jgi:hypothetical protein